MNDYLISIFGEAVKLNKPITLKNTPLYLTYGRKFFHLTIYDVPFVLIETSESENFTIAAYKKQAAQLSEIYSSNVAFSFKTMTKSQRNSFISNAIPFLCDQEQIFLPFLGVAIHEKFRIKTQLNIEKMMPVTQMLFLYLAYSDSDDVIKSVAADELNLSRPNITRASSQLLAMGLIKEYKTGKESHMVRLAQGWDYYKLAQNYLINPIQKKLIVKSKELDLDYPLAGQSALSQFSMLNPPYHETRAIFKSEAVINNLHQTENRWESEEITELELWKYNPAIFAKSGVVDPISMLCSIETNDERVEEAMNEVMKMKI